MPLLMIRGLLSKQICPGRAWAGTRMTTQGGGWTDGVPVSPVLSRGSEEGSARALRLSSLPLWLLLTGTLGPDSPIPP